jgi:hypothetical protein
MEIDIEREILDKLSEYRKKRKATAYLGATLPFLFGLGFLFEQISLGLSRFVFIVAALLFILWLIRINLNCYKKCPRCGKKYCMNGLFIWCWSKKCLHCDLELSSTELGKEEV